LPSRRRIPVALTIAGSDSGGGAGIEADLKTFAALGVHGVVAITSVTAQNTYSVVAVHDLPPDMVVKQIEAVAEDMGVDAAKTGMLSNSGIIEAVARTVKRYGFPLVVDPVMIAKSGAPLLRPEAMDSLIKHIIPIATVVTPNRMEAEKLTGISIKSVEDAKRAAKKIVEELGAQAAVVKGGHIEGDESVDVLYYRGRYREYRAPRIREGCTHGTGCAFSAAIAAELAKGKSVEEAVTTAKRFITLAIDYGLKLGKGHCPVNPMAWLDLAAERWWAIQDVEEAKAKLLAKQEAVARYAPEVGINIVKAIRYPYARSVGDVAAIEGRIVRTARNRLVAAGSVAMGASSHLARLVLAAMEYDTEVRAAVNIAYHPDLVEAARRLGLAVVKVDRRKEPEHVKKLEGASMQWIVKEAIKQLGRVPDIIYDEGDVGKEAMIRVLGRTAVEAVDKLLRVVEEAARKA
jgi:hydroxymethylpyrimidine/phosphomethylpyrimidine kinase